MVKPTLGSPDRDGDVHSQMSIKLNVEEIEDLAEEVSAEELRDFLAADGLDVPFDPDFKERLRAQLWSYARARFEPEGKS